MELFLDAWPILALPLGWLYLMVRANTKAVKDVEKAFNDYRVYVSETLLNTKIEKAVKPIRERLVSIEDKIDKHLVRRD